MHPVSCFRRNSTVFYEYPIEKESLPCVLLLTLPIVPKSFFSELDKINKILADSGTDKKWTAEEYVRDQFEKAMKETMLRAEDKVVK